MFLKPESFFDAFFLYIFDKNERNDNHVGGINQICLYLEEKLVDAKYDEEP